MNANRREKALGKARKVPWKKKRWAYENGIAGSLETEATTETGDSSPRLVLGDGKL